jgi:hypothetical protein
VEVSDCHDFHSGNSAMMGRGVWGTIFAVIFSKNNFRCFRLPAISATGGASSAMRQHKFKADGKIPPRK